MGTDSIEIRLTRAKLSLDGLSVGDAFGQCFFSPNEFVTRGRIENEDLPPAPWYYTDDTEMALALFEILQRHGRVEQDDLADAFAKRYAADPSRGYGGTAHPRLLEEWSHCLLRTEQSRRVGLRRGKVFI